LTGIRTCGLACDPGDQLLSRVCVIPDADSLTIVATDGKILAEWTLFPDPYASPGDPGAVEVASRTVTGPFGIGQSGCWSINPADVPKVKAADLERANAVVDGSHLAVAVGSSTHRIPLWPASAERRIFPPYRAAFDQSHRWPTRAHPEIPDADQTHAPLGLDSAYLTLIQSILYPDAKRGARCAVRMQNLRGIVFSPLSPDVHRRVLIMPITLPA
jgi:hypothetical protein